MVKADEAKKNNNENGENASETSNINESKTTNITKKRGRPKSQATKKNGGDKMKIRVNKEKSQSTVAKKKANKPAKKTETQVAAKKRGRPAGTGKKADSSMKDKKVQKTAKATSSKLPIPNKQGQAVTIQFFKDVEAAAKRARLQLRGRGGNNKINNG